MANNSKDWVWGWIAGLVAVGVIGVLVYRFVPEPPILSHTTTYCTEYVKLKTIEPKHFDNGKHSDEMYVITWEDGLIEGRDQGAIEPFRCTEQVKVPDRERQPEWKPVTSWGRVEWER